MGRNLISDCLLSCVGVHCEADSRRRQSYVVGALALVLVLGSATQPVEAKEAANTSYPWNTRPAECVSTKRTLAACAPVNWVDYGETIERLDELIEAKDYVLLESALNDLSASQNAFVSGKPVITAVYRAIDKLVVGVESSLVLARVKAWKKAVPNSRFVLFAEVMALRENAWEARGTGISSTVQPESHHLFVTWLRQAETILLNAPDDLKDLPIWHHFLLIVALDSNEVASEGVVVFRTAVQRWPRYFSFYDLVLERVTPQQGYSWISAQAFIDHWSHQLKGTEGVSMYARLYVNFIQSSPSPVIKRAVWRRLKTSFIDLIARYPDLYFKNSFAGYACLAKDKVSFLMIMRQIPHRDLLTTEWPPGFPPDACKLWAEKS